MADLSNLNIDDNYPLFDQAEEERLLFEQLWRDLKLTKTTLASVGKTREDLFSKNVTLNELKQLGFQKADFIKVFNKTDLINIGFVKYEFINYGFNKADWIKLDFKKEDWLALGYTTEELQNLGFTREEWEQRGFSKSDWLQSGLSEEQWLDLGLSEDAKRERRLFYQLWEKLGLFTPGISKSLDINNKAKPLWPGPDYNPEEEKRQYIKLWLKLGLGKAQNNFWRGAYSLWAAPDALWKVAPKVEVALDGQDEFDLRIDEDTIPLWDGDIILEEPILDLPAPFIGKKDITVPIAPYIGKKTAELARQNINPKTQAVQPIEDVSLLYLGQAAVNANKRFDANKGFNIPSNSKFRANADDKFSIKYKDRVSGASKTFWFDLLPAMENRGGSKFGNIEVPEVKPGILQRIDTKHKNIVVPGCTPVVQTIGINNAMLNLVGAMTGEENINTPRTGDSASQTDVLLGNFYEPFDKDISANKKARQFMNDVVLPGTEVDVYITASNNGAGASSKEAPELIKYTGVIISYKFYAVRKNKAFYTIDLLVTKYINV